jgi:hypothetical protein
VDSIRMYAIDSIAILYLDDDDDVSDTDPKEWAMFLVIV